MRHQPKKRGLSLALACDRTGVSDRAAAIIASSVLKDVGIISSNDTSGVIDRSKLRRESGQLYRMQIAIKLYMEFISMVGRTKHWLAFVRKANFTEKELQKTIM